MNSIRNKIEDLFKSIGNNFDIISIAETKLDTSFPNAQFSIPTYKLPYRLDINDTIGGILVYVKKGLPSLRLKISVSLTMFNLSLFKSVLEV